MRILHAFSKFIFIFLLFSFFAASARTEEVLVMPFSCTVENGEPVLTPSDDRGYRIIGPRAHREFTACSPTRPSHCRKWSIHKFKVDCAGKTVPWTSLVAAGDGYHGAWVEDGQFVIQMPWTWTLSPDDPCARLRRFGRRPFGRRTRYCNRRRQAAVKPTLKMPAGFAPLFGIDAIFVEADSRQGADLAPQANKKEETIALYRAPAQIPPLPQKNKLRHKDAQKNAEIALNNAPERITPVSETDAPANEKKKAQGESQREEKTNTASAPQQPEPTGYLRKPTILNAQIDKPKDTPRPAVTPKPAAVSASSASLTPPSTAPETPAPETIKHLDFMPKPQQSSNEVPAGVIAQTGKTGGQDNSPSKIGSNEILDNKLTMVLAGVTVLGAGLIVIGIVLLKRKKASSPKFSRDISTVSIGGDKVPTNLATREVALIKKENQDVAKTSDLQKQTTALPLDKMGDTIPKTRKDAFEVLGISITPDASPTALKKIVDGLRLSWHPDHAANEADRRIRESRMKQINAAWEIISERNTEKMASNSPVRSEATG